MPATSFNPTFACPDPTNSLYTETINGTCYALAAIHISSKVMPRWLWATFEPNNNITNPNRCDPKLYGACLDSWGTTSSQPYGKGQTQQQSPELHQAMAEAHLNPAFNNYFLTGVQTEFVDNYGKPIQLGNSFVEFNQGVAPGKSSCITCHQYANFNGKQPTRGDRKTVSEDRLAVGQHRVRLQSKPKRKLYTCDPQFHDAELFLDPGSDAV